METTPKKTSSLRLSKEDIRRIERLADNLGESKSDIIRRAINKLYDLTFKENDND